MSDQVTIEDVARACGVSRATVSRVINGESRVRPQTIEKVNEAIRALGYHPNLHAKALSGGGTDTVALMLPGVWRSYHAILIEGVEEVASREGFHVLVRTKDYLEEAERLFDEGRVEGFIFRNMDRAEEHAKLFSRLARRGIPFLLIGNPLGDYPAIAIDNVGGGRMVARHFLEHGFRRMLYLSGPADHADSQDRYFGFRVGLEEGGLGPEAILRAEGDYTTRSGFEAAARLIPELEPEAVFAANDRMALGVLLYLRKRGLGVPGDMAVVGFDDAFFSEYLSPPLTTVRPPIHEMGTTAMKTMASILRKPGSLTGKIILPTSLVVRASCGCPFAPGEGSPLFDGSFNSE
ncbi:MAG TPA: LacI family DNA-binding transcriptional regulator [Spirochaetales bacterium]|nr:LacI family DNA-binding transcriptional regulator [Spirochaetales bacterium]HRY53817.1 LacI family DNA-binding transcriptional regulator [Spirochaetia bacterium]HRZ65096.1 LacI family DNA-binding transcriptional regulator [Spirochaetia bacterium]